MKKMLTGIIVFGLFLSMPFAQGQTGQTQTRFGIGFEFQTIPSYIHANNAVETGGSSMGLYIPIETGSLIIEPHISYYSYSREDDYNNWPDPDYEESIVTWSLTAGIFKQFGIKGSLRSYGGVRIGKQWTEIEINGNDVEVEAFILAPTVGAEYFIADNFSVGGECMYARSTAEDDENNVTTTITRSLIIPVFIVRFYF